MGLVILSCFFRRMRIRGINDSKTPPIGWRILLVPRLCLGTYTRWLCHLLFYTRCARCARSQALPGNAYLGGSATSYSAKFQTPFRILFCPRLCLELLTWWLCIIRGGRATRNAFPGRAWKRASLGTSNSYAWSCLPGGCAL